MTWTKAVICWEDAALHSSLAQQPWQCFSTDQPFADIFVATLITCYIVGSTDTSIVKKKQNINTTKSHQTKVYTSSTQPPSLKKCNVYDAVYTTSAQDYSLSFNNMSFFFFIQSYAFSADKRPWLCVPDRRRWQRVGYRHRSFRHNVILPYLLQLGR